MRLLWTSEALEDRRAIYAYIEPDNPNAALTLDELFSTSATRLINHPDLGRPGRVAETRELVVHRNYILIMTPPARSCACSAFYTPPDSGRQGQNEWRGVGPILFITG